jgi:hypothetical protein
MKILKKPGNVVFDTKTPNVRFYPSTPVEIECPLHHAHNTTDLDFLKTFFPPKKGTVHPIIENLSESFYYKIKA